MIDQIQSKLLLKLNAVSAVPAAMRTQTHLKELEYCSLHIKSSFNDDLGLIKSI